MPRPGVFVTTGALRGDRSGIAEGDAAKAGLTRHARQVEFDTHDLESEVTCETQGRQIADPAGAVDRYARGSAGRTLIIFVSLTEDTLMFGGTTLVVSRPDANRDLPWWYPGDDRPDEIAAPWARRDEGEEDVEDDDEDDEDDEDETLADEDEDLDDEDDEDDEDFEDEDEDFDDDDEFDDEDFDDLDDEDEDFDDLDDDDDEFDDDEDDEDDDDEDDENEEPLGPAGA
jgi:hypothetical protein